jgi:hypothetical protein
MDRIEPGKRRRAVPDRDAVAAGPFLMTTTDALGFFVFLGLASTFLLQGSITPGVLIR